MWHPCKFQRVSRLGSVTARQSSSGHQPYFTALNRGHHLYSTGRPSRWASAHILVVIRPHRNTTYVDAAYLTDRVAWSVGLSVTLVSPAKNLHRSSCRLGCGLGWARESCIRWGSRSPHGKGQLFGGEWASHCKIWGHSTVVYAKTAEQIGMPFGLWARMGHRNHVLDGGP